MKNGTVLSISNICRSCLIISFFVLITLSSIHVSVNAAKEYISSGNYSITRLIESSHLIEIDLTHEGVIPVQESIVFSVTGNGTTDKLMITVPETAEVISVQRTEMMGSGSEQVDYTRVQDTLYFNDPERFSESPIPALYEIKYVLYEDSDIHSRSFSKTLQDKERSTYPISRLAVLVNDSESVHVRLTDATGNRLKADEVKSTTGTVSFTWINPDFDVLTVNTHVPVDENAGALKEKIGILLILALITGAASVFYSKKKKGDINDLEDRYEALVGVIIQIEEDWNNKVITEQEFKELHKKYKQHATETKKRIMELQEKSA